MFAVLKKDEDESNGNTFHLRQTHCVVLQKVLGSDAAMLYDDMVLMAVGNYNVTAALWQVVASLLAGE